VPRERAADVLEAARARETREAGIRERYRNGELGIDMNRMREPLAAKGLTYVEQEPPR
jgi:4-hydroxy-4-methyl-2-oxoglutarate aldolase